METWLVYAIISLFFAGFLNFGFKIIAQRNYNTSLVTAISYSVAASIAAMYYFTMHGGFSLTYLVLLTLLFAFGDVLFYFFSTLSRVKSLENIDTVIFFPLYKTLFPIIMTVISVIVFSEHLDTTDYIGIICGILVPLMLMTKKESITQKNLRLGITMLLFTSVFASISTFFSKMAIEQGVNIDMFNMMVFGFGALVASCNYKFGKTKNKSKKYTTKGLWLFSLILGMIYFGTGYTFMNALEGNLAIVVTINSFSILIPIILSVIFYKEEMTYKKAFVIFLSIVSVILFI